MTLYLFYLKKYKDLYAWTTNKDYYKAFKSQRNMDLFVIKKRKITLKEFNEFDSVHFELSLGIDIVGNENGYTEIILTQEESNDLMNASDFIYNTLLSLENYFQKGPYKNKFLNSIMKITTQLTSKDNDEDPTDTSELNFDTITLAIHLLRHTILKNDDVLDNIIVKRSFV